MAEAISVWYSVGNDAAITLGFRLDDPVVPAAIVAID